MHCVEASDRLLEAQGGPDPELDRHVAECAKCARVARGLVRVESALAAALVVAPPLELQRSLAQLAVEGARPQAAPWWQRLTQPSWRVDLVGWLAQRPHTAAAQGLAAVMLALASWQVFGWLTLFRPVVGDVGYAVELVVASPASVYLGGMQLDVQSLGMWSVVGLVGWLVSESGPVGRSLSSLRPRLP